MRKKIKVFLAAFTNQTNAQNLSCRALAKYLDKERFEVYTLELSHGNLPALSVKGVHVFKCSSPVKISAALGFVWGFLKADVVYAPNAKFIFWQRLLKRLTGKRLIKSMRMLINDHALKTMWRVHENALEEVESLFSFADEIYAITPYMREYHKKRMNIDIMPEVITPLTEIELLSKNKRIRTSLKTVLFLGKDWQRKGLDEFVSLANTYGDIIFFVVGKGGKESYLSKVQNNNVQFYGQLSENELIQKIAEADIQFLPSRAEGLPRGYIESLANGLPCVLYKDYGMEDYVTHGVDGFLADNLIDVESIMDMLLADPNLLKTISEQCSRSSDRFRPERLVKIYERIFSQNPK